MIKVLFDHQTFSLQRYGGISRYFANVYHTIQKQDDIQAKISALYTNNYYLKDFNGLLSNNPVGKLIFKERVRGYLWNRAYSKRVIDKNDFDIFHPTYYHTYFLERLKKPFVLTVHDMIHEIMPEYFPNDDKSSFEKRQCIEKASHIIAISENTKRDLQHIFQIPDEKITVIHHGFTPSQESDDTGAETDISKGNYLLFVGDRSFYKNFYRFAIAAAAFLQKRKDFKLICAGGGPFQHAEIEHLLKFKIMDRVTQITATERELDLLYQNTSAFIFPSIYEGFGLPILEAFKQKAPIIMSDIACFREIAGDASLYFNPFDPEDILAKIEQLVDDKALKDDLIKKGSQQRLNFTMEKCANKTIDVYRNLL